MTASGRWSAGRKPPCPLPPAPPPPEPDETAEVPAPASIERSVGFGGFSSAAQAAVVAAMATKVVKRRVFIIISKARNIAARLGKFLATQRGMQSIRETRVGCRLRLDESPARDDA